MSAPLENLNCSARPAAEIKPGSRSRPAMRIGNGFGWTTLVAAEMVAATKGLGYMVLSASQFLQTSTVIMGIIVIAIIAYAFDMLMRFVERRVVPWKGRM